MQEEIDIARSILLDREKGTQRLVAEYRDRLYAVALALCRNHAEAEDLAFRTIERAVSKIESYEERDSFYEWLQIILLNLYRNSVRGKMVRSTMAAGVGQDLEDISGRLQDGDIESAEKVYSAVDSAILRDAIDRLPDEMKEMVILHYFMDMPLKKIAKILSMPVGTVMSRLYYARLALAQRLGATLKKPAVAMIAAALLILGSVFAAVVAESLREEVSVEVSVPEPQPVSPAVFINDETINPPAEREEDTMNIPQRAATLVAMTASLALNGASSDELTFITGGSLGSTAILSTSSSAPDIVFEGANVAEYEPAYAYFYLHTAGGDKGSVSTDIEQEILRPYNVVRTTEGGVATMTVQFQGVTRTHILPHTASITIKFMQSGDNIVAYVMRAAALKPLDIELGLDLDAMVDAGSPRVEAKPLTGDGKYNVSVIAMRKPAEDVARIVQEGDSINDTFVGNAAITVSHAPADTATYDGYLPNDEWVTIATNHDLADLDAVDGIFHYKAGSIITNVQQTAYNLKYLTTESNVNSFGEKVCQFQRVNGRYVCAVLVYFRQNGNDVQVHTRQGLSCYLDSNGHEDEIMLGVDFERYGAETTPKRVSYNTLATSDSDTYQGVKNLRCKFRSKATVARDGYMPNGNNDTTNYWTVVADNHTLSDLVGVDAFYHTGANAGHYVTCENLNLSTSTGSCQFQYDNGNYVFCIGLDLRQTGNCIEARTGKNTNWYMQKTLYESGVVYYGIDFYNYNTTTTPKRNTYGGYGESDSVSTKGLKNLRFRFATGGVVYAAASTAYSGHDLKFMGSADAPLAVRTSTSTLFPSNGVITVAPYAELKLAGHVANAQWTQYRVLTNGTLRLKGASQTVRTDQIDLVGGTLLVRDEEDAAVDSGTYINYLTLMNGAYVRGKPARVLNAATRANWIVAGDSPSYCESGLVITAGSGDDSRTFFFNVNDVTRDEEPDFFVSGDISDYGTVYNADGFWNAHAIKAGGGTMTLSGNVTLPNEICISNGTVRLDGNCTFGVSRKRSTANGDGSEKKADIWLAGGALETAAGATNAVGVVVAKVKDAPLNLGDASSLTLAGFKHEAGATLLVSDNLGNGATLRIEGVSIGEKVKGIKCRIDDQIKGVKVGDDGNLVPFVSGMILIFQ